MPDKASLAWQGQGVVLVLSWLIGAGQVLSLLAYWAIGTTDDTCSGVMPHRLTFSLSQT